MKSLGAWLGTVSSHIDWNSRYTEQRDSAVFVCECTTIVDITEAKNAGVLGYNFRLLLLEELVAGKSLQRQHVCPCDTLPFRSHMLFRIIVLMARSTIHV
jgi:hypothetical protein